MLMRHGIGHICPHCNGNKHSENCLTNLPPELHKSWRQGKNDRMRGMRVVMNAAEAEGRAYNMGAACAPQCTKA